MNIVFLDIDGVLINRESLRIASGEKSNANSVCVDNFNKIIESTNAKIILSSTWRVMNSLDFMKLKLNDWGVKGKLIGYTPIIRWQEGDSTYSAPRYKEIQRCLDSQSNIENFVIIDDIDDMGSYQDKLVCTDFEIGLTKANADQAIKILRGR